MTKQIIKANGHTFKTMDELENYCKKSNFGYSFSETIKHKGQKTHLFNLTQFHDSPT